MCNLKLKNSIFKIFIELFIWNKKTRSKIKARWAKLHLKKYVEYAIKNSSKTHKIQISNEKPIIWQYWHQGIENAPLLIQKCIESTKKHNPECEIKVLSFDSINDYVTIPQRYYDLLEQNKMPIALFSDILRLYLLTIYGGTWVDSTIYFTDSIPKKILDSDFTTVQKDPLNDSFGDRMSCYFIHAKQNTKWTNITQKALEKYWEENDYLIHYFIFEHIVSMVVESSLEFMSEWKEMEYINADDVSFFRKFLYEDFNENLYNDIKKKCFMHKLSYKILQEHYSEKSFYNKITG